MRRILAIVGVCASAAGLLGGTASIASASSTGRWQPGGLPYIDNLGPATSGAPVISSNWSGYAVQSTTKFNYVFSTFVQPAVTCDGQTPEATSNWVGLDGYANDTVEQDGTFAICHGTTPTYTAWYEMYPAGSIGVFHVKPGDVIASSVRFTSGKFVLTVTDLTSGKTHTDVAACGSCQRASAEWIVERPAFCATASCTNALIAAMPNFGTTSMDDDIAANGAGNQSLGAFDNIPIEGIWNLNDQLQPGAGGFESVDTASALAGNPSSFSLTYDRAGQPVPVDLG